MQKQKMLLGLVGRAASGKGTAVQYIQKKYRSAYFRFSAPLDDILKRLDIPNARPNQAKLFAALQNAFGDEVLAHALKKNVLVSKRSLIIIEGIRRWPEVKVFQEFKNFYLIAIAAQPKNRYQRMILRGEKAGERGLTYEEFLKQEKLPTEKQIAAICRKANFTLNNDGTPQELYQQIDAMMRKML